MADPVYDLAVIGSGRAGQKAAVAAAKLGKRVAVVDRPEMIGGVCIHTGTIPSKALREAILYLSGFRQRAFYGRDYTLQERISVADLASRVRTVLERETEVVRSQLKRNGVDVGCVAVQEARPGPHVRRRSHGGELTWFRRAIRRW